MSQTASKRASQWLWLLVLAAFLACAPGQKRAAPRSMAHCVFFQKSTPGAPNRGWAALLPGTSGLAIFGDSLHYFAAADRLSALGFDVLLIDYKNVYRALGKKISGNTGERIRWATERALDWAQAQGWIRSEQSGVLVGWSLAGEGIWLMLNDLRGLEVRNIRRAALFYPSNQAGVSLQNGGTPLLVLSGKSDNVTPESSIRVCCAPAKQAALQFFENAHHGFDVRSLAAGRSVRFPPVFGKKYRFQYDSTAAAQAQEALEQFLLPPG